MNEKRFLLIHHKMFVLNNEHHNINRIFWEEIFSRNSLLNPPIQKDNIELLKQDFEEIQTWKRFYIAQKQPQKKSFFGTIVAFFRRDGK